MFYNCKHVYVLGKSSNYTDNKSSGFFHNSLFDPWTGCVFGINKYAEDYTKSGYIDSQSISLKRNRRKKEKEYFMGCPNFFTTLNTVSRESHTGTSGSERPHVSCSVIIIIHPLSLVGYWNIWKTL